MTENEAGDGIADAAADAENLIVGGGRMGEAIRAFDWSATSLGGIERWPRALIHITRLVLASKQPMCFWWGNDLVQLYNDAYVPMLGKRKDAALGRPFREIWADVWADVEPQVRQALSGEATWGENVPLVMTRNGYEELTYWTFSYSPLRDDEGVVRGILNIVTETTDAMNDRAALQAAVASLAQSNAEARRLLEEQRRWQSEQRMLQRELVHRMKNTLSVVQAIVSQSMRHTATVAEVGEAIGGRLAALSRAQDILTETNWASADIVDVVRNALMPHKDSEERFRVAGPPVQISAHQSLGMALAIHELATNAAKYGALVNPDGRVSISWAVGSASEFHFEWRETGGPAVRAPERRGFGSRLTERILADYFFGTAAVAYEPAGVVFSLTGRVDTADPDGPRADSGTKPGAN